MLIKCVFKKTEMCCSRETGRFKIKGAADLVSDASWLSLCFKDGTALWHSVVMLSCDRWAERTNAGSSLSGRDEGKVWTALFPSL